MTSPFSTVLVAPTIENEGVIDVEDGNIVGSFGTGGVVPETGLGFVHKGEVVIPSSVPRFQTGTETLHGSMGKIPLPPDWPPEYDIPDPLGRDLALELGKGQQNVQRQTAHRRGGIESLSDRDEGTAGGIEALDQLGEVGKGSGETVDLVDHDHLHVPRVDVGQKTL